MATMGRIGLLAAYSSEQGPGFMDLMGSTATWITATIPITVMRGRCRSAVRIPSRTFRATRRGMGKAMWVTQVTIQAVNTVPDFRVAGTLGAVMVAAVTAKKMVD
jgi:hypothetical protein